MGRGYWRGTERVPEVLEAFPDLTLEDAYAVQFAINDRRRNGGDRSIGYKVALTSGGMQHNVGIDHPVFGEVFASTLFQGGQTVPIGSLVETRIEPEIAVLLKKDLVGPGVTFQDALLAIEAYAPLIELAHRRSEKFNRSEQMVQIFNAFNWGQVMGTKLTHPAGIDMRYEGMVAA